MPLERLAGDANLVLRRGQLAGASQITKDKSYELHCPTFNDFGFGSFTELASFPSVLNLDHQINH